MYIFTLTSDGRNDKEVQRPIGTAKTALQRRDLGKVLKDKIISLNTKNRILKCYAWSTLMYGCESGNIRRTPLAEFCDDRLKTSRRHMRSRNQNRQDIVKRWTILIDDLIKDSISYCARAIVRISDDFYDDCH